MEDSKNVSWNTHNVMLTSIRFSNRFAIMSGSRLSWDPGSQDQWLLYSSSRCQTPVKRQTSILRPSESFIRDRQESVQLSEELSEELASFSLSEDAGGIQLSYDTSGAQLSYDTSGAQLSENTSGAQLSEDTSGNQLSDDEAGGTGSDSDSLGDVSVVHAQLSSLVVVDRRQIQHFEGLAEEEACPGAGQGSLVRNSKAMLDTISR